MTSLVMSLRESIRYRGKSGQYSWMAHRISGLAILLFLLMHVWDTANAYFWPQAYAWSLELFKFPLFALGEIALMAAVLYHAFNGLRITLLDFKPEWWKYQKASARAVWILFFLVFIPIGIYMFIGLWSHCAELAAGGGTCWTIPRFSDLDRYAQ